MIAAEGPSDDIEGPRSCHHACAQEMREDEWCALVKRLKMMSGKRKSFVQSFADKTHHLEAAIQSMQAHASAVGSDVDGKWGEVGGSSVSSRTSRRSRSHPGSSHFGMGGGGANHLNSWIPQVCMPMPLCLKQARS